MRQLSTKNGLISRPARSGGWVTAGWDEAGRVGASVYVVDADGIERCAAVGTGRTVGRAARRLARIS